MKSDKANQVVVEDPERAFQRFENAVRQSLTVSKTEILRREQLLKQNRPPRSRLGRTGK